MYLSLFLWPRNLFVNQVKVDLLHTSSLIVYYPLIVHLVFAYDL